MSDDPSQVDTPTLVNSLIRDIDEAQSRARQAYEWLTQARVTAYELKRRLGDPQ